MKKPQLSTLGKAINHFMILESISWYRLAMLSDVNQSTLSKIKWGDVSPTLYTMERIAKALNINHSDIILKAESLTGEVK